MKLNWKYLLPIGLVLWIVGGAITGAFGGLLVLVALVMFVLGIIDVIRSIWRRKVKKEAENTSELHKKGSFIKRWSKEIIIALIFALIAAVIYEKYNKWQQEIVLENDTKAVAIIETFDKDNNLIGQGSGVFTKPDGTLITNDHVIKDMVFATAKISSGAYFKLQGIVAEDKNHDIAVLKFDATGNPYMEMGDSDSIHQGDSVKAIGAPIGLENTVSAGIISNVKRQYNGQDYIQFTAPISPGNSGGGLFDNAGNIIGLTAASIEQQDVNTQNLNLAVPINLVKNTSTGKENDFTQNSPQYFYAQGVLADDKDDYDSALKYYNQAIALDSGYADAYIGAGGDYYEKGDYKNEVANYEKAVNADSTNSSDWYYLATAYEDVGAYDKSAAAFTNALKINPDDKDTLHDFVLLYIASGQKQKAVDLIEKLSKLDEGWSNELKAILVRTN